MKACPFCAEQIQDEAVKCRYCHEYLTPAARAAHAGAATGTGDAGRTAAAKSRAPWYCSTASLVIAFCCVGPLMLPLVWIHPTFSRTRKMVWTAALVIVTLILTKLTMWGVGHLKEYYSLFEQIYPH